MSISQQTTYITGLQSEIRGDSPSPAGKIAVATDTKKLFVSTGTDWIETHVDNTQGLSYNIGVNSLQDTPIIHVDAADSSSLLTKELTTPSDDEPVKMWLNKTDDLAFRSIDSVRYRVKSGNPQLELHNGSMMLSNSDPKLDGSREVDFVPTREGDFTVIMVFTPSRGTDSNPNLFVPLRSLFQQGLTDVSASSYLGEYSDWTTISRTYIGTDAEGVAPSHGGRYHFSEYEIHLADYNNWRLFQSDIGNLSSDGGTNNTYHPDFGTSLYHTTQEFYWRIPQNAGSENTATFGPASDGRYRRGDGTVENPYKSNTTLADAPELDWFDGFTNNWLDQPQIMSMRLTRGYKGQYNARCEWMIHTWHHDYNTREFGERKDTSVYMTGGWQLGNMALGTHATYPTHTLSAKNRAPIGVNELMVFNNRVSDTELNTIGQHLKNKWGCRFFTLEG